MIRCHVLFRAGRNSQELECKVSSHSNALEPVEHTHWHAIDLTMITAHGHTRWTRRIQDFYESRTQQAPPSPGAFANTVSLIPLLLFSRKRR